MLLCIIIITILLFIIYYLFICYLLVSVQFGRYRLMEASTVVEEYRSTTDAVMSGTQFLVYSPSFPVRYTQHPPVLLC